MNLPKFNFSKSSIASTEQLNQELEKTSGDSKFFRPGNHQVTITGVEYQGPARDTNWGKFLIHLKGTGGQEIRDQILVPFSDVQYKNPDTGKTTLFVYKRFTAVMAALGVTNLSLETLADTLNTYFSRPEKTLVGQIVNVDIGYKGTHIAYKGKDASGNKMYVVAKADGTQLMDMVFPGYDEALTHCEDANIEVSRFVDVLKYNPSVAGKKVSGW